MAKCRLYGTLKGTGYIKEKGEKKQQKKKKTKGGCAGPPALCTTLLKWEYLSDTHPIKPRAAREIPHVITVAPVTACHQNGGGVVCHLYGAISNFGKGANRDA